MKAVILLSGGVDSCVILAKALEKGMVCHALSFDYGQRHRIELKYATQIAKHYGISHSIINIDPRTFANSSLTTSLPVPKDRNRASIAAGGIPTTYVPARNTLFISYAMGQAEIWQAQEIHVGFNAVDRAPYPDCRVEYLEAIQGVINLATRQAVEGSAPKLIAPLISMDKDQIFKEGIRLRVPLQMTFSCYDPTPAQKPCRRCDACILRLSVDAKSNDELPKSNYEL